MRRSMILARTMKVGLTDGRSSSARPVDSGPHGLGGGGADKGYSDRIVTFIIVFTTSDKRSNL